MGTDPLPTSSFRHRIRVRYAEIDGQSVVFNSRYLEYADVAITEYFRSLGISSVPGPQTPEFHVAKATVEFISPIRFDEEIVLCVRTLRVGRSSWTVLIELRGALQDVLYRVVTRILLFACRKGAGRASNIGERYPGNQKRSQGLSSRAARAPR